MKVKKSALTSAMLTYFIIIPQVLAHGKDVTEEDLKAGENFLKQQYENTMAGDISSQLNRCDGNFYYDKGDYIISPMFTIKPNSDQCVKQIIDSGKNFRIGYSSGGDTRAALNIGNYLSLKKKDLIIEKACMSACFFMSAVSDRAYACNDKVLFGYHKAKITDVKFLRMENELNKAIQKEIKSKMNQRKLKEFDAIKDTPYEQMRMMTVSEVVGMGYVEGVKCN